MCGVRTGKGEGDVGLDRWGGVGGTPLAANDGAGHGVHNVSKSSSVQLVSLGETAR